MGEKGEYKMKMIKAIFKKYSWSMLGVVIGLGIWDLYQKREFIWTDWLIRIIIVVVLQLICGAIEYKSGKLE